MLRKDVPEGFQRAIGKPPVPAGLSFFQHPVLSKSILRAAATISSCPLFFFIEEIV